MKYRPEIDGLRAVAVVPVILFHAGFEVFSGGFVGVDVFFVISGYLITTLLLEDIEHDRFSLARFYERRIRRIFPALFLVVLACIPAAWMLMLPDQYKDFSQSIGAVLLFASNVLFWQESGYFGGPAVLKPLLHTWSLAVEEQYYVFFPLLLVWICRFSRKVTLLVLLALLLASLAATEWGWRFARMANFFLTPFRIWELIAGSMCAIVLRQRTIAGNQVLSALGLAMVLAAVFLFDESTPFPSLMALVPVGGSCLCVLFARPGTLAARLLTLPLCIGIGLISYSAYLWHQPLFAFVRMASPYRPADSVMLGLSVFSMALAYLSWRFVEQPFRRRNIAVLAPRRNIFALASVAAVVLMAVALIGQLRDGFPNRFDRSLDQVLAIRDEWQKRRNTCHVEGVPRQHPIQACVVKAGHPSIDVALIGDSHSLAISEMVQEALKKDGLTSYGVSYTGCIGLPGFYRVDLDAKHQCDQHNRTLLKFLEDQGISTVVLTSRFPLYLSGERFDNGEGGIETGEPVWIDDTAHLSEKAAREDPARRARVLEGYRTGILDLLTKFNVVLVYPIPEAGWDVVRYVVSDTVRGGKPRDEVSTDIAAYEARTAEVLPLFDALAHPNLRKIIPARQLCDSIIPGRCANAIGTQVFYRDEDHLSYEGARLLAPEIAAAALSLVAKERK